MVLPSEALNFNFLFRLRFLIHMYKSELTFYCTHKYIHIYTYKEGKGSIYIGIHTYMYRYIPIYI